MQTRPNPVATLSPTSDGTGDDETSTTDADSTSSDGADSSDETEDPDEETTGDAQPTSGADDASTTDSDSDGEPDAAAVLYINFDGVTLTFGDDDSTNNTTPIFDGDGTWSGVSSSRAAELMPRIESLFAPFPIEVTDVRPASGPYTMVVITADPSPFFGNVAVSTVDCGNLVSNNIGIVFDDPAMSYSVNGIVSSVGFQTGIMFGLNPIEATPDFDVMEDGLTDDASTFTSTCQAPTSAGECAALTAACPDGEQNSEAEFRAALEALR